MVSEQFFMVYLNFYYFQFFFANAFLNFDFQCLLSSNLCLFVFRS